jgi:hypothetical protein
MIPADNPAIVNPLHTANIGWQMRLKPKQIPAHDPDRLPKTNQDRIVRAEKLMSFDPNQLSRARV